MILISFKIVVVFAEIKTKSADVILKTTTILKEMRIAQLSSQNERTLVFVSVAYITKKLDAIAI